MKMNKNIFALIFLIVVFVVIAVLWPDSTSVNAVELLIDVSELPSGWSIKSEPFSAKDIPHVLLDQNSSDFSDVQYVPPGDKHPFRLYAAHTVWNYGNSFYAWLEFRKSYQSKLGHLDKEISKWSYDSNLADQSISWCKWVESQMEDEKKWIECTIVERFGSFISVFSTPIGPEYNMSESDLTQIMNVFDLRIKEKLIR